MLYFHIVVAVMSLIYATFALVKPMHSSAKLSYGFIGATTASGVALIFISPEYLLRGCLSYILYLIAVTALTYANKNRQVLLK
ncbi:MAG: hypothetical protein WAS36_03095 [Candidatus Saccharimonadales bacterium]